MPPSWTLPRDDWSDRSGPRGSDSSRPSWFSGARLLILCLPLCLLASWIAAAAAGDGRLDALGNPLGGDFAMFYIAGQMALHGEWSNLYDEPLQQARLLELFPGLPADAYLPFRYPPLVAILLAPLAGLPYLAACLVFVSASLAMWSLSLRSLVRLYLPERDSLTATALMAIASAPVMLQTLIDGQASLWWFAIGAACWGCLERKRPVVAGCWLALAACKPNVMLLLAVALVVRFPRMVFGMAATGLALLGLTWLVAGGQCLSDYRQLAQQLALQPWQVETPFWKVQSLLSWTELCVGESWARRTNLLMGLTAAVAVGVAWRRQAGNPAAAVNALCAALVINALCNPYTPVYDLILLCLGLVACVAGLARGVWPGTSSQWLLRRDVQVSLGVVLAGPVLSQGLARSLECGLPAMPVCLLGTAGYWWLLRPASVWRSAAVPRPLPANCGSSQSSPAE